MGGHRTPGPPVAIEGFAASLVQIKIVFGTRLGAADPRTEKRTHPARLGSTLFGWGKGG